MPSNLLSGLQAVETLTRRRRWGEALEQLQALHQRYPRQPAVLRELVNVCYELKDFALYLRYCRLLNSAEPGDADTLLALAGAYMTNSYAALAIQHFRGFLSLHPDHARASEVRKTMQGLQQALEDAMHNADLHGADLLALAVRHDTVRLMLELGEFQQGRQAARKLIQEHPTFAPAYNNLSQIEFLEGHYAEAIRYTRRVLEFEPRNYQALANLSRHLYLDGQLEEAHRYATQLKAVQMENDVEIDVKKAETFTFLEDDEAVLAAYASAEAAGYTEPPYGHALLPHLAAVAAFRQGHEEQARRYWQHALKLDPHFDLAKDNLADLKKPPSERHAPWPYPLNHWVPPRTLQQVAQVLAPAVRGNSEKAVTSAMRRFVRQHRELQQILPILLARGDPDGRLFAIRLIRTAETPELLAMLRDFALSRHGPDPLRVEAANFVSQAGLLPPGMATLWLQGEWQPIMLINFELYGEPLVSYPPPVERLVTQALAALNQNELRRAEQLMQQALAAAPDSPSILNNLGMIYQAQGRTQEANDLLDQIVRDYPDYFFGQLSVAKQCIVQGKFDQAQDILKTLTERRRLHFSEFDGLCAAHIQLSLAEESIEGAETWLRMWSDVDDQNPKLAYWRQQIDQQKRLSGAKGIGSRLRHLFKR